MTKMIHRRRFLTRMLGSGLGLGVLRPSFARAQDMSPSMRLNIGVIGVANQGLYNLRNVLSENVVAICDVDNRYLDQAGQLASGARRYRDYRKMLERSDLDAVVVATPDHTHAVAAVAALESGCHVYCEKPLARTVSEVRRITQVAREQARVTQIGTQIHAGTNYRRVVELIQAGVIGPVEEVHVWLGTSYGGRNLPVAEQPPAFLDYDLWLGPAVPRPFSSEYVPQDWRHWWAFGGGVLADFGCHFIDLPYWALNLRYPDSVEVVEGPDVHPESVPPWLVVKYQYLGRAGDPPVKLVWYHGGRKPPLPAGDEAFEWRNGIMFVGNKGFLLADYSRHVLLPHEDFQGVPRPPAVIPDSVGHHLEWINACKGQGRTTCGFEYSGPLSESVLLGNVAYRVGERIDWDAGEGKARGCARADQFLTPQYRNGWSI